MKCGHKDHYSWTNPQPRAIVYQAYTPTSVGKIVDVDPPHNSSCNPSDCQHEVTVRKKNGKEWSRIQFQGINCFRCLVEDHKRKGKKHEVSLKEAEAV